MPDERVFSEQEVGEILRRAVELTESGTTSTYTPGVTRAELEKIAAEVGVSPDALARAILEKGEQSSKKGPLNLTEEFERVVEGELDPSQFDLLTEGIKTFANQGSPAVAQIGRSMTMSVWTGVGQAKVDITSRNGRTKMKVKSNAVLQFLMTLHPALILSLVSLAALSERGMAWIGAALAVFLFTVGAFLFTTLTKKGHRRAEKLADDMRERIAATLATQPAISSGAVHQEEDEQLQQRLNVQS